MKFCDLLCEIKFVVDTVINFYKIKIFTFEEEINGKIPFLEALLPRNNDYIYTAVNRKKTNIDIFLNSYSFGPNNWKWGTLRPIVTRAFEIGSTETSHRIYERIKDHNGRDHKWPMLKHSI